MELSTQTLLMSFIYGAAAFQSLLLSLVLWWRPNKSQLPNRVLAVLNVFFCVLLLNNAAMMLNLHIEFPFFLYWPSLFWLLVPPAYYLYARTRLSEQRHLYWWDTLHAIPFLVGVWLWRKVIFINVDEKLALLNSAESVVNQGTYRYLIMVAFPILGAIYLGRSIFLIQQFRKKNAAKWTERADTQLKVFQWVYSFLLGFIILAELLYLLPGVGQHFPVWLGGLIGLVIPTIVFYLSYSALIDPNGLFESIQLAKPVFKSQQLPKEQAIHYAQLLEELMEKKQLYLNAELSQEELAQHVGIQSRQLSRLIREEFNATFNEFINGYRVKKVTQLMKDEKYQHWSLIALAYEAGFNSKSSFNRIFKKNMGITPSEFLRKHQPYPGQSMKRSD